MYLSPHCIVTWWVPRVCSAGRSFPSCFSICDPTDILWVAVKKGQILSDISGFSIATQRILVRSHIWDREGKGRLEMHSLHTDCVMIRSEILNCRQSYDVEMPGFGGKTGPFPMGRGFRLVRPVATGRIRILPGHFDPLLTLSCRHDYRISKIVRKWLKCVTNMGTSFLLSETLSCTLPRFFYIPWLDMSSVVNHNLWFGFHFLSY